MVGLREIQRGKGCQMKQQETEIYCMCGRKRNKVIESMLSIMLYTGALAGQTIQTEFIDGMPWFFFC